MDDWLAAQAEIARTLHPALLCWFVDSRRGVKVPELVRQEDWDSILDIAQLGDGSIKDILRQRGYIYDSPMGEYPGLETIGPKKAMSAVAEARRRRSVYQLAVERALIEEAGTFWIESPWPEHSPIGLDGDETKVWSIILPDGGTHLLHHGLGTRDVFIDVLDRNNNTIFCSMMILDENTVQIDTKGTREVMVRIAG